MSKIFHLKLRDLAILAGYAAVLCAVYIAARWLLPPHADAVVVIVGLAGLAALLFEVYRRLEPLLFETRENYRQLEALSSTHASLDIGLPLPPLRGWAVSPDFLNIQITAIMSRRPRIVVELGSGASTVVSGACLRSVGAGRVVALDHDSMYAEKTRASLRAHGLQELADVLDTPLVPVALESGTWQWYDLAPLGKSVSPIDLLIVDGPPNPLQPLSRYPALPAFIDRLSPDATVIVDDGKEPNVERMVKRWLAEFPEFSAEYRDTEKGTYVLHRNAGAQSD